MKKRIWIINIQCFVKHYNGDSFVVSGKMVDSDGDVTVEVEYDSDLFDEDGYNADKWVMSGKEDRK